MRDGRKQTLFNSLVGLKGTIIAARQDRRNCHYNVGVSLKYLRDAIISELEDGEREFAERAIQPLVFSVPKKGDLGVWTVSSDEAYRLYSQLAPLVHNENAISDDAGKNKKFKPQVNNNKIFLVHGHDEAAREKVARYLEKLELSPVILHEQANAGSTVIEKLESYSKVSFSIVLLTPDDEGRKVGSSDLSMRARQNVILELGYFIGLLGRKNVCALYAGDVEIPSDYFGVLFIPLDSAEGWRLLLAKELQAAGLPVDMNRAI